MARRCKPRCGGLRARRLRPHSAPPCVLFPRPRTFLPIQIRPTRAQRSSLMANGCLTAGGSIWSAAPIQSPVAGMSPPRTPRIRQSGWPPGTARRSMAAAPPTAKSTTWLRCRPPIRRCRCRATLGDQSRERLFGHCARQRSRPLSRWAGDGRILARRRRPRHEGYGHGEVKSTMSDQRRSRGRTIRNC